jgi:hypothetical protein
MNFFIIIIIVTKVHLNVRQWFTYNFIAVFLEGQSVFGILLALKVAPSRRDKGLTPQILNGEDECEPDLHRPREEVDEHFHAAVIFLQKDAVGLFQDFPRALFHDRRHRNLLGLPDISSAWALNGESKL